MGSGGRAARLWRRIHLGGNPLARPGDRFEARLLLSFVLLALVAIPFAASLGSETYASRLETAQREADVKHQTTAVLLADAPVSMTVGEIETVRVSARWELPDGAERVGKVTTYRGTMKGSEVPVWLDEAGNPTSPPATEASAATDGVSVGVSVWLGVVLLCALVYGAVHATLNRLRAGQWARDWARVERQWSRR